MTYLTFFDIPHIFYVPEMPDASDGDWSTNQGPPWRRRPSAVAAGRTTSVDRQTDTLAPPVSMCRTAGCAVACVRSLRSNAAPADIKMEEVVKEGGKTYSTNTD